MKRIISLLIALPLLVSTAFAGGVGNIGDFNFDWGGSGGRIAAFYSPFTTTLSVLTPPRAYPGTTGTFTRASAQYVYDHENVLRKVESGSIAIPGSRIVTNLLTYSEDLSNAIWAKTGTCTVTGTNVVNFPNAGAVGANAVRQSSVSGVSSTAMSFRVRLSGSGTITLMVYSALNGTTTKQITLSATPTVYVLNKIPWVSETIASYITRVTGDTATSVTVHSAQLENVTAQSNQNPGEYVKTTSAPVSKCFSTLNGNTVDANGVVTEATGAAISGIDGPLLEVSTTNKVTAYGIIPADTLGSELATNGGFDSDTAWTKQAGWAISGGVAVATATEAVIYQDISAAMRGKIIRITYTVSGYVSGSVAAYSGATVGTQRAANGTYTEDILVGNANGYTGVRGITGAAFTGNIDNISIKEVTWAVGTKSYYTGSAFQQNITGLTLSGDTAAVLSIVTDETEILAAGLGAINPGYKVYKLDNSAGVTNAKSSISGATGNTNKHSTRVLGRVSAGTGRIQFNSTLFTPDTTFVNTTYGVVKAENQTPADAFQSFVVRAEAGTIIYFLMPQLEEQPAATSYIPTAGATATRAATSLSYPIAGNFGVPASIKFDWTPQTSNTASERYLLGSYTDANNSFGILHDGTNLIFRKRVGGTNYDATKALTPVAGTTYSIGARINSDYTLDIFANGTKGTSSADTHAPAATTTFELGTLNGASGVISSQIKNLKIYKKKLPDSLMYLDMKYRSADSYLEVAA